MKSFYDNITDTFDHMPLLTAMIQWDRFQKNEYNQSKVLYVDFFGDSL